MSVATLGTNWLGMRWPATASQTVWVGEVGGWVGGWVGVGL